ncbi:MAG: glutathione synthase [Alphaproteobacteria bacterium]|nr:glutathione synthase [Alphaproteobacteria bacterium]
MERIAAFQMDPLSALNPRSDSTLLLMHEAQKRGYHIFHYLPSELCFENGAIHAYGHFVKLHDNEENFYTVIKAAHVDLRKVTVVWMRQDPPFDMAYITATHILEALAPDTLVLNNPEFVRNCPEKWFVNQFPEFLPPTLISTSLKAMEDFRARHKDIIIKPLYGFGGNAVFRIKEQDGNFHALLEWILSTSNEALVVQKFLPEVKHGDIRVILIDGKVAGQIGRVPAAGEIRSNFRVGGSAAKLALTTRQQLICEAMEDALKSRGLLFVGIDLIGDYLTEINVTSPTGLRAINAAYDTTLEAEIWDAAEKRLA